MLNVERVRADFPILSREVNGKPLVYLDNASTSQKPRAVIEAISRYYENTNANIHRGIHVLAEEATAQYEEVRVKVARFIGAPDPRAVIFVRNTTEAINLAARTWGKANLKPGDEIVVTEAEHHSNLLPWQMIATDTGAKVRAIPITDEGVLDLPAARALIGPKTRLVAVAHMSNVLGTINPVKELAELAHANGALILLDGAQSVPHLPVDVGDLGCDFLAFSSHKMLGPTGVGVLWARRELLEPLDPLFGGGGMIREVWIDRATWADVPERFEAGTPNIGGVIALGTAIDYLSDLGMKNVRSHEVEVTDYALKALRDLGDDVRVFGPSDLSQRGGVVSFYYRDVHPHDVATVIDQEGVAIRASHHCCQPLMRRLGVAATCRASFYVYNCKEEADVLVRSLKQVKEIFSSVGAR